MKSDISHYDRQSVLPGTLAYWLLPPAKDYLDTLYPHFIAEDSYTGVPGPRINSTYLFSYRGTTNV